MAYMSRWLEENKHKLNQESEIKENNTMSLNLRDYSIYIVGVGGTGSQLCNMLAQYLPFSYRQPRRVILVDDDVIEERNAERQNFDRLEAGKHKVEVIKRKFTNTSGFGYVEALPVKLDVDSLPLDIGVMSKLQAKIIVFICVDSARARNAIWSELVGGYDAKERQYTGEGPKYQGDFIIVDGGNSEYTGQVTSCIKTTIADTVVLLGQDPRVLFENVRNADPSITSCQERQISEPQTVMANIMVANLMFNEFQRVFKYQKLQPLVKFDLVTCQMKPEFDMIDLNVFRQQILEQKLLQEQEEKKKQQEPTSKITTEPVNTPQIVDPQELLEKYEQRSLFDTEQAIPTAEFITKISNDYLERFKNTSDYDKERIQRTYENFRRVLPAIYPPDDAPF